MPPIIIFYQPLTSHLTVKVVRAQTIMDSVAGLDSLHGFGFSLSANVDVDGNEYNGKCF